MVLGLEKAALMPSSMYPRSLAVVEEEGQHRAPAIRKKGRRRQHQGGREVPPADASRGGSSGGWGERRQHSLQEEVAAFASYRGDGGVWDSFYEVGSWMNFLRIWGYSARKLTFPDLAK
uniref:Uncharacterized protein n=1 Tax=Oryza rufipogon TaxID=4529 RepID=A0A0E0NF79_ORYRU